MKVVRGQIFNGMRVGFTGLRSLLGAVTSVVVVVALNGVGQAYWIELF